MVSSADEEYVLGRGYAASARLNLQHYLWRDQLGFLTHPSIPMSSFSKLRVADVGTGAGSWILDLARTLPPTAQLDGFDIDISQTPPQSWIPRNVTFEQMDATEVLPDKVIGKYDVVYVRLFVFVVRNNDPQSILANLARMLRPGGYLQWSEADMQTLSVVKAYKFVPTTAIERLRAFWSSIDPRLAPTWPAELRSHMTKVGLDIVCIDRCGISKDRLAAEMDTFMMVYDETAAIGMLVGDELREYRLLIAEAARECRAGVAFQLERVTVVARRPCWG